MELCHQTTRQRSELISLFIYTALGHVRLDTTNRYAEISLRTKEAALKTCTTPVLAKGFAGKAPWRTDASLLEWLDSL